MNYIVNTRDNFSELVWNPKPVRIFDNQSELTIIKYASAARYVPAR